MKRTGLDSILLSAVMVAGCKAQPAAPVTPDVAPTKPEVERVAEAQPKHDWSEPWPVKSTEFADLVPASTPYVLVNDKPLPPKAVKALEPFTKPLVRVIERAMAEEGSNPAGQKLVEELGGKLNTASLARIGVDANPRFIIYGIGVAPVLRFRLADPAKVQELEKRLREVPGGREVKQHDFHGQRFDVVNEDDGTWTIAAYSGQDLVVAIVPQGALDDVLPLVFGQRLPEEKLYETGWLEEAKRDFGLTPHYLLMVDVEKVVATMMGQVGGLELDVATAMKAVSDDIDPVCAAEALRLASLSPRAFMGFRSFRGSRIRYTLAMELEPEVGKVVARIPSTIPGVPRKPSAAERFAVGLGIDFDAVAAALTEAGTRVGNNPFRCDDFIELNKIKDAPQQLQAAKSSIELTGLGAVVTKFDLDADVPVAGYAALTHPHPKKLLAMLDPKANLDRLKPGKVHDLAKVTTLVDKPNRVRVAVRDGGAVMATKGVPDAQIKTALDHRYKENGTIALLRWNALREWPRIRKELELDDEDDPIVRDLSIAMMRALIKGKLAIRLTPKGTTFDITLGPATKN